jgi:hypothetical protein
MRPKQSKKSKGKGEGKHEHETRNTLTNPEQFSEIPRAAFILYTFEPNATVIRDYSSFATSVLNHRAYLWLLYLRLN